MIPLPLRKALFFFFVGVFLVSTPLVVLYTAGYRFNRGNNTLSQTGTLAVASIPKGATITLGTEIMSATSPTVFQRLSPGNQTVELTKEGYHPWKRSVSLHSGSTTYITAPLYLDENTTVLETSTQKNAAQNAKYRAPASLPQTMLFTETAAGIEVSESTRIGTTFLALLPKGEYTPLIVDAEDVFVRNANGEIFFITRKKSQPVYALPKNILSFAWNSEQRRFAWTDGNELTLFSCATQQHELITRQSDFISSLSFAHAGESIVLAGEREILGIDLTPYEDGRVHTRLLSLPEQTTTWFSEDGRTAYLETQGILSLLPLTL